MKCKSRIAYILLLTGLLAVPVKGQYEFGISALSLSFTSTEYGLPFMLMTPINPGIEAELSLFTNEKQKSRQDFSLALGYYYHEMIANGTYLYGNYNYKRRVADLFGIDLFAGLGYLNSIYPGDSYLYNSENGGFDQHASVRHYAAFHLGFGISYIGFSKMAPFIHYDMAAFNIWEGLYLRTTAMFKVGVKIKLVNQN